MNKRYFYPVLALVAALFFWGGCVSVKNVFSGSSGNILAGSDNVSSEFHSKVVQIVADTERIRGLKLLYPIKYYIISEAEAQKMGIERAEKIRAFYTDNAVYFLKNNLTGDWDILAVHEFVHALQDQNFGLSRIKIPENDRDAALAVEGLIEGDAVYTMVLYAMEKGKFAVSKMIEDDSIISKRGMFPMETALKYKFGARFVGLLKKMGGWEAVNIVFTKYPPAGTFHLLHPEKYLSCRNIISPEFSIPAVNILSADTYGEIDLLYFLLELDTNEAEAKKAANGWAGGVVVETRSSETVIITKWENKKELDEFAAFFAQAVNKKPLSAGKDNNILSFKIDRTGLTATITKKK